MKTPGQFFHELKRRKVVRVALVYAATAFVLLQAADIMLPRLGVPESGMTLIVVLVVLGFPLAVVLGWAFEVTPDGVKTTAPASHTEVAGNSGAPALLGWGTILVTGTLVVMGLGIGLGWGGGRLLPPGPEDPPTAAPSPDHPGAPAPADDRSIAVMIQQCYCGVPFDLEAAPNLRSRIREAGVEWPPPTVVRYPAKDS